MFAVVPLSLPIHRHRLTVTEDERAGEVGGAGEVGRAGEVAGTADSINEREPTQARPSKL